jgi:hypothetical protein
MFLEWSPSHHVPAQPWREFEFAVVSGSLQWAGYTCTTPFPSRCPETWAWESGDSGISSALWAAMRIFYCCLVLNSDKHPGQRCLANISGHSIGNLTCLEIWPLILL